MRNPILWLALVLAPLLAQELPSYKDLDIPELREVQVPEIAVHRLGNGLTIYLLEDHELPLVRGSAMLTSGSLNDPAGKAGLAALTGTLMRSGGVPGMSGDQLNERLEFIAASVETSFALSEGSASFSCLKENLGEVLGIFSKVLLEPQFAEDKLELAKVAQRTAIAARNDQPSEILRREFRAALYGQDSTFARKPEYASIAAISREDLQAFHKGVIGNKASLAIWGDFDSEVLLAELSELFEGWQGSVRSTAATLMLPGGFGPGGIYYVEKTDVNQASIRIGHFSVGQLHKDYVPLQVLSQILGGGFSSRMVKEIRTRRGLAYSAYGVFVAPPGQRALFVAGCDTKLETTGQAIEAMLGELERIRSEPVTADELLRAQDSILNNWVFKFDSRGAVVQRHMEDAFHGLPEDFLASYKKRVSEVTAEELLRVAKEHLQPEKAAIVVVGNAAGFDRPLSDFGTVTPVDISIPAPAQEALAIDDASRARGLALLDAAAKAAGGADKLASLHSLKMVGNFKQGPMAFGMTHYELLPDKALVDIVTPGGAFQMIRNADRMARVMGPQIDVESMSEAELAAENLTDPRWLLGHFAELTIAEQEGVLTLEDSHENRVEVTFNEDGLIASLATFQDGQDVIRRFSDYREVEGLRLHFKMEVESGGQVGVTLEFESAELNPELDEALFAIPEQESP